MSDIEDFWNDWKTKREEVNSQTIERDARYGYAILKHEDTINLEIEVIRFMKEGWKPTGGVFGDKLFYYQAMVKF